VDAAYEARSELLYNANGVAEMYYYTHPASKEDFNDFKKEVSEQFGFGNEFTNNGEAQWTTTWYTKGDKKRFDVVSPEPNQPRPLIVKTGKRVATDKEKSIHYDVIHKEAYINRPLTVYANPFGQYKSFDIHQLYRFNRQTIPELLYRWFEKKRKSEITRSIIPEKVGQIDCMKIYCDAVYKYPSGRKDKMRLTLWLAPKMSYSLVKARIWNNAPNRHSNELSLLESYDASYEESSEHPGIWLLKSLKYIDNQRSENETLEAVFRDTKVGIEIPDETFTFDGLGVPAGTVVYDKTVGGEG